MPRPTKCRRVCHFPENLEFVPSNTNGMEPIKPIKPIKSIEPIVLTVDEFETIRLIDKEGLSQEECGLQLGVARTTVQKIYNIARKKLAEALVLGLPLKINGGDFQLCNGNAESCYKNDCFKKQIQREYQMDKGGNIMRIAVTYEDGNIFQHFGHTKQFKMYDVEEGKIVKSEIIDTNGSGHGALAGVLSAIRADVLICGGIGGGAQMALRDAGIKLYGGVNGNADEAVRDFIAGNLSFNPDVHCTHHDHEHNGEYHACHEHGCGKERCGNKK